MVRKPRSVYVAFEAFPRLKGASAHIASMVRALAEDFSPVLLVCLGYGDMPAYQDLGDVQIRRFMAGHPNMLRRAVAFGRFVHDTVAPVAGGLELAVFRDPWSGLPLLEMEPGVALVFEANALPSWELGSTYPRFGRRVALQAKIRDGERRCLRGVERVLVVSGVTAKALRALEPRCAPIAVIPNSADPVFEAAAGGGGAVPESGAGATFGYVGSLHPWQGVERAVDAFSLIARGVDARMVIVTAGRGPAWKALRRRIRKKRLTEVVDLIPGLPPERLAPLVRTCAFTVAPLQETSRNVVQGCCPVKIVESMAAGVPVIATDLAVTREMISSGRDGLLVDPSGVRPLAEAMLRLLNDRRLCTRLGRNARETARVRFSREVVHERLRGVFWDAVRAGRVGGPVPVAMPWFECQADG